MQKQTPSRPWKIKMEAENHLFEKEIHLNQNLRFWPPAGHFSTGVD